MTDLEINKALALAIGWPISRTRVNCITREVYVHYEVFDEYLLWMRFSFMDWRVIGPIAAKYDCFPMRSINGRTWWSNNWFNEKETDQFATDTPQKAIALAVIAEAKS